MRAGPGQTHIRPATTVCALIVPVHDPIEANGIHFGRRNETFDHLIINRSGIVAVSNDASG